MAAVTADFGLPVELRGGRTIAMAPIEWSAGKAGARLPFESGALNDGSPVRTEWQYAARAEALSPISEQRLVVDHTSTIFGEWFAAHSGSALAIEWGAESDGVPLPFEWGHRAAADRPGQLETRARTRNETIAALPLETVGAAGITADAFLPFASNARFNAARSAPASWLAPALCRGAFVETQLAGAVDLALPAAFAGRLILASDAPLGLAVLADALYGAGVTAGWNQLARSGVAADNSLFLEWISSGRRQEPFGAAADRLAGADAALRAGWLADLARRLELPEEALAALLRAARIDQEYIGAAALIVDRLVPFESGAGARGLAMPIEFGTAPAGLGLFLEILAPPRLFPAPPGAVLLDRRFRRKL